LEWICSQKHVWIAEGSNRIVGHGCPYCTNQKVLKGFNDLATTNPELAKEANGWDPSAVIAGTTKKLSWKCSEGHVWEAAVSSRNQGRGCSSCVEFGFSPNENAYLYFLIQPHWEIYQIGITNVPDNRLKKHNRNGFELIELRGPMEGYAAQELERALLKFLKSQKADLSPEHIAGKFDGYSESWTIDSFQINTLKELIDRTREAGY
jgi:predicted GIY-YIG superfamily endonuclease